MPDPLHKRSATVCICMRSQTQAPTLHPGSSPPRLRIALCTGLACLLPLFQLASGMAAEAQRPDVGESYIFNQVAEPGTASAPGQALEFRLPHQAPGSPIGLLDPTSHLWAGAQALSLNLERAAVLLARNVIASSGDARAAAASHADGRIQLFGTGACNSVHMPDGHPAYALALAREGGVLAAWAQGVNRLVFFDLSAAGCPASVAATAMRGQISLTLSASGAFLAAQDESGQVWIGPRGGEIRSVATMSGAPAAIGFSTGEGVLFVLDAQGRGGAWNPRTGKGLRTLEVPGGPFARGDFQEAEARLWTVDGRLVRWDVLHNRPAKAEKQPGEAATAQKDGWLELQGEDLYHVRPGLSWQAHPLYEPHLPQLSLSRHAACLRLSDVDGVVRYFDARAGKAHAQCFADDWEKVVVNPDGTAQIPGLKLRIFDSIESPGSGSKVNVRALSEQHVVFWTGSAPTLSLSVEAPPLAGASPSQKVADESGNSTAKALSVPLWQDIAADAPALPLLLR